jgi:exopolyphosphatase/guanosine-5'-triphosphate,3'-diphosphate pyrophosphatase
MQATKVKKKFSKGQKLKITTIIEEAIELGKSHDFDQEHSLQVSKFSLRLFDELQSIHRMGNSERIWLRIASLLHDVGKGVSGAFHHKASRDIIVKQADLPFRKRVRKMIGLIARYHRGELPEDTHKYYRRLDDESRQCVRKLAALLRLADALDAEHKQMVVNLSCAIRNDRVILYILTRDETDLRKVTHKADLFEQSYGRKVDVRTVVASRLRNLKLDSNPAKVYARVA